MRTLEDFVRDVQSGSAFVPANLSVVADKYRCVGRDALRMRQEIRRDFSRHAAILAESLDYASRTTTRW